MGVILQIYLRHRAPLTSAIVHQHTARRTANAPCAGKQRKGRTSEDGADASGSWKTDRPSRIKPSPVEFHALIDDRELDCKWILICRCTSTM